ncbi:hypothetical protein [Capnocytophaga felis]|uniref:Uncharacterized protein n=1 Tax=Capnocytophaga felis TaxID=2267611 RepID=A0A5M4BCC7_9FLAO|nr:hypothetical protein [Capnocytophaga felis]GET47140.1 hypothetical protein RCZ01_24420 [Capnocytophaga felis]GET49626.1 hypothetical protein RCZ02_24570 [Capnocytophaga felis]
MKNDEEEQIPLKVIDPKNKLMIVIKAILKSKGQEMVAMLKIEDCFICDEPYIFIKALLYIRNQEYLYI